MIDFYWEENWPNILAEQETTLRYPSFDRETALELGLLIRTLAREKYRKAAAIRIIEDGTVIFAYKMPGTSAENDWWMDRKLAVSRVSGKSSLRTYVEARSGMCTPFWNDRPDNFAPCGGCMPVFQADGHTPYAHVLVSGMEHFEDHQIIADAMAEQLQLTIPGII